MERRPRDLPKGRKQNLEGGDDLVCDDQGDHGDQGDQGDHGDHGDQGDHGDHGDHDIRI